jgi:hypothetical protein
VPGLAAHVGLGRVGERECGGDDRAELAPGHQIGDHGHALVVVLDQHDLGADAEPGCLAGDVRGEREQRDQGAARAEDAKRAGGVVAGDRIEHDVYVRRCRREVGRGVVDDLVRAQAPHEVVVALAGGADHVGMRADAERVRQHAEHLVARLEQRHAETDRLDHAGHVPAERERRLAQEHAVSSVGPVARVDTGRAHLDEDLGETGLGPFHFDLAEYLGAAEHLLPDRAHRRSLHDPKPASGRWACRLRRRH